MAIPSFRNDKNNKLFNKHEINRVEVVAWREGGGCNTPPYPPYPTFKNHVQRSKFASAVIYMFLVSTSAKKKNVEAIKFLGILKSTSLRIKYIFV